MTMPNVMISDSLEPHAVRLTFAILQPRLDPPALLKCCCKPSTGEPFMGSTITSSPLFGFELVPNRPADFNLGLLSAYFSTSALPFLIPHPFPSFSSTSVLPFSGNVLLLPGTFPLWFSGRPRITLFSDGAQRFSGEMVYPWRPSTIR